MAGTKYSKLDADFTDLETSGHIHVVQRRGCPKLFKSLCFVVTIAFCVGVLATVGGRRLLGSLGTSDTDWLSQSSLCSIAIEQCETHVT